MGTSEGLTFLTQGGVGIKLITEPSTDLGGTVVHDQQSWAAAPVG